jgi:hypothetical protein
MHTQQQAIRFIEGCFGIAELSNGGLNASVVCPLCNTNGKRKLAIRTTDFACHCWVCGYKSRSMFHLVYKLHRNKVQEFLDTFSVEMAGMTLDALNEENTDLGVRELPRGSVLLAPFVQPWLDGEKVPRWASDCIRYLVEERGVSTADFWLYKFCGCSDKTDLLYRDRVLLPSFDEQGNLNFFTARTVHPKKLPRYFNPPFQRKTVVINEVNIQWNKPLLIVEGMFDMLGTSMNVTCLLGSSLEPTHRLFQKIIENSTEVVLCLDADAKAKEAIIAQRLYAYGIAVKLLSLPAGVKDLGQGNLHAKKSLKDFEESGMLEVYSPSHSLQQRLSTLIC